MTNSRPHTSRTHEPAGTGERAGSGQKPNYTARRAGVAAAVALGIVIPGAAVHHMTEPITKDIGTVLGPLSDSGEAGFTHETTASRLDKLLGRPATQTTCVKDGTFTFQKGDTVSSAAAATAEALGFRLTDATVDAVTDHLLLTGGEDGTPYGHNGQTSPGGKITITGVCATGKAGEIPKLVFPDDQ